MDGSVDLILIAIAAFTVAGLIKGVVGMGLPTAALAGMTLFIDPRDAITLLLLPMLATNFWQMVSGGEVLATARKFRLFAIILFFGVLVTTFATSGAANATLLIALGSVIMFYVIFAWIDRIPEIPDEWDNSAQSIFALISGLIGGLTAAWAAPLGIYLSARRVAKDEFIRASGFLITVGSVPICIAYAVLGFVTPDRAALSAAMVVPSLFGMWIGVNVRNRFSQETFRKVVLVVFALLALNLLRRAIF